MSDHDTESRLTSALAARAAEVEPDTDAYERLAERLGVSTGAQPAVRRVHWPLLGAAVLLAVVAVAALLVVDRARDDETATDGGVVLDGPGVDIGPVWPAGDPQVWPTSPEEAARRFFAEIVGVEEIPIREVIDVSTDSFTGIEVVVAAPGDDEVAARVQVAEADGASGRYGVVEVRSDAFEVTSPSPFSEQVGAVRFGVDGLERQIFNVDVVAPEGECLNACARPRWLFDTPAGIEAVPGDYSGPALVVVTANDLAYEGVTPVAMVPVFITQHEAMWPATDAGSGTWPRSPEEAARRFFADILGIEDVRVTEVSETDEDGRTVYEVAVSATRDDNGVDEVPTASVVTVAESTAVDDEYGVRAVRSEFLEVTEPTPGAVVQSGHLTVRRTIRQPVQLRLLSPDITCPSHPECAGGYEIDGSPDLLVGGGGIGAPEGVGGPMLLVVTMNLGAETVVPATAVVPVVVSSTGRELLEIVDRTSYSITFDVDSADYGGYDNPSVGALADGEGFEVVWSPLGCPQSVTPEVTGTADALELTIRYDVEEACPAVDAESRLRIRTTAPVDPGAVTVVLQPEE